MTTETTNEPEPHIRLQDSESEVYLGLQPNEEEAIADCGCRLVRCDDESDDPFLTLCPLHAGAAATLACLRDLLGDVRNLTSSNVTIRPSAAAARLLLDKATP